MGVEAWEIPIGWAGRIAILGRIPNSAKLRNAAKRVMSFLAEPNR